MKAFVIPAVTMAGAIVFVMALILFAPTSSASDHADMWSNVHSKIITVEGVPCVVTVFMNDTSISCDWRK